MSVIDDDGGRRDGDERQHNNQQCRSEWLDRTRQKQRQHDIGGRRQCKHCRSDNALATMTDDDGDDEYNNQIQCRGVKAVGAKMRQQRKVDVFSLVSLTALSVILLGSSVRASTLNMTRETRAAAANTTAPAIRGVEAMETMAG